MTDDATPTASSAEAPVPDGELPAAPLPTAEILAGAPEPPAPAQPEPNRVEVPVAPVAGAPWRPNYLFLAVVSIISLGLDLGSKAWAKGRLEEARSITHGHIEVVKDTLSFTFAKNRGGAWGLLQDEPESIRRPFFLGISVLAIAFIVSLYRKLTPRQWALKWGLPLVLGGALGNLVNRIQYNYVVDFIDYRAGWVRWLNGAVLGRPNNDQWPTFNVADVAIVVGVVLMGIDMFTPARPTPSHPARAPTPTLPPPAGTGSTPPESAPAK